MNSFVVKNTILKGLLDLICPDTCLSCGRIGDNLCDCCKKNIKIARKRFIDGSVVINLGLREGVLAEMIYKYKFNKGRFIAIELGKMLGEKIALEAIFEGGSEVVVVPVPTAYKHIRMRGFDHAEWLARYVAEELSRNLKNEVKFEKILGRLIDSVQVGKDAKTREKQARGAFCVQGNIASEAIYIVIDDVLTTGASVRAARELLVKNGAKIVVIGVVAVGMMDDE